MSSGMLSFIGLDENVSLFPVDFSIRQCTHVILFFIDPILLFLYLSIISPLLLPTSLSVCLWEREGEKVVWRTCVESQTHDTHCCSSQAMTLNTGWGKAGCWAILVFFSRILPHSACPSFLHSLSLSSFLSLSCGVRMVFPRHFFMKLHSAVAWASVAVISLCVSILHAVWILR